MTEKIEKMSATLSPKTLLVPRILISTSPHGRACGEGFVGEQAFRPIWEPGVSLSWGSTNALPQDWLCRDTGCHTVRVVTEQSRRSNNPAREPRSRLRALVNI